MNKIENNIEYDETLSFKTKCLLFSRGEILTTHYIIGNGGTFPGRVLCYCPHKHGTFNASLSDMEEMSDEAKWWMKGFLCGNEVKFPDVDEEDETYLSVVSQYNLKCKKFHETGCWDYE